MQDIPGHVQQVEALMFTNMLASCRFLIACVCKVTCGCLVRGLPCLGVLAHEGGLPAERHWRLTEGQVPLGSAGFGQGP